MPKLVEARPKYRRHKASGQAIVSTQGHDFYLGPWNSKASKVEYDRVISEWLAAGRQLPMANSDASDLTIVEVLACLSPVHRRSDEVPWHRFRSHPSPHPPPGARKCAWTPPES
jgi:hypothetical protein